MKSLLRLFKAVEIIEKEKIAFSEAVFEKTIGCGFVFSPEVIYNYSESVLLELVDNIKIELGLSAEQMNTSFHKSWKKVKDASIEQLVFEQLIHYFTTYGFERLGLYDKDSVYIPNEKLEIPEIGVDGFKLIVIKGYTKAEIKEKIIDLLKSGIALQEDTIKDVVEVCEYVGIDTVDEIKNKEVKVILCDRLDLVPTDPVEFLRYLVYKATGKTLLIKNAGTIEKLKEFSETDTYKLFASYAYVDPFYLEKLARIFYRFKPLFLTLRKGSLKPVINKIRKLAVKYHKPMKEDYLNEITSVIKNSKIDDEKFKICLDNANTFRKIRLAYALKYRLNKSDKSMQSFLYKIRNGKAFATQIEEYSVKQKTEAKRVLNIVLSSLADGIQNNVGGKKVFIPSNIKYALPATEKQFTGYFPSGTCVTVSKDMVAGIHWDNVDNNRIDLDLSLISAEAGKIGWDAVYRTEDKSVLFSGDMTDASNGATELFYIKRQLKQAFILVVNYYNYNEEIEVPFDIIIAKEQVSNFEGTNYMVNPNNVKAISKTKISEKQKVLGLLITTKDECRFYFSETSIGRPITSSDTEYMKNARDYLVQFYSNTISFNDILIRAGAQIVESADDADIDLSPENIEKDTFIKLLS